MASVIQAIWAGLWRKPSVAAPVVHVQKPQRRVVVDHKPRLTLDGDGDYDYWCPKCQLPAFEGQGRRCPSEAPQLHFRTDGTREWFAVTCGVCGFHDEDPQDEPVYGWREDLSSHA